MAIRCAMNFLLIFALAFPMTAHAIQQEDETKTMKAAAGPPLARIAPTKLSNHGIERVDNYFWLRERENPEVIEPGTVSMACHRFGYVGIVQLEDGRIDLAAAFDVEFVKRLGGLAKAAHLVITESGLAVPPGIQDQRWQGTVKLTHRRSHLFGEG